MNSKLRLLAVGMLTSLALTVPALAQSSTPEATASAMSTDSNGMITYAAPDCSYGGEMKSIQATDANTVVFTLCNPDGSFPSKAAFATNDITSWAYIQKTGGNGDLLRVPVGTGPYKIDHWDQGNEIVLDRNDDYWGDKAKTSKLIFQWNADSAARLTQLQSGAVDGYEIVGATDFDTIKNDSSLALYSIDPLNISYLGINNTYKPFDDVRVREAIAYGIDKQRLVDNFYPAGSLAMGQFNPPGIFGTTANFAGTPYDPDKAKSLLAEAAKDDGFTLPLSTLADGTPIKLSFRTNARVYLPEPQETATDIQTQLAAIGINIQLDVQQSATLFQNAALGKLSLSLIGWGADWPDATDFLDTHFGAGADMTFGDKFPDIVQGIKDGAQNSDPTQRQAIYDKVNAEIRDEIPMVPLAAGVTADAFKASIGNVKIGPISTPNFWQMTNPDADQITWLQSGEPESLYCPDETDGEALSVCEQTNESLLAYEVGGTAVVPSLATDYSASADGLTWTFHLRPNVKFSDGSTLTANDVVMSYAIQWDAASPYHKGDTGVFDYWSSMFGGFLNPPAASS
ncbi:MAG TPA: ABC transporter substrate-binding protein [Phototrophicaceae bacterium]|nr:ABC transporter substrate-binding protein [Phototrophicaceae bacterium]